MDGWRNWRGWTYCVITKQIKRVKSLTGNQKQRENQKTIYVNYPRYQYCRSRCEGGFKSHLSVRLHEIKATVMKNRIGVATEVVFQAHHTGIVLTGY